MEKEKIEKLKESIDEVEEKIGVEIFIHTIEEGETKEKEIIAKIARCERLKQEYSDKIMRLQQRSSDENPAYDKVKASLSREIGKTKKTKMELEKKKVGAINNAADANERTFEEKRKEKVNNAGDRGQKESGEEIISGAETKHKEVEEAENKNYETKSQIIKNEDKTNKNKIKAKRSEEENENKCYKCCKPGHRSRECNTEVEDKCFKCGERGHYVYIYIYDNNIKILLNLYITTMSQIQLKSIRKIFKSTQL